MVRWKYNQFEAFQFGRDLWDESHRFETSWLLSPWALFAVRALISLYAFTVTFFIIGWEASNQPGYSIHDVHKSFSFFTVLCYWGSSFYFLVSAIHTFTYAHTGTSLLTRLPRPLQALHYLFWSTITTYPFLVTIVYWAILFAPFKTTFALWSNISQHALNSLFGLFEIIFTRINPAPWIHLLWLIVILALYLGTAYITYATKHYYVYGFLNPNPEHKIVNADGEEENVGGVGKGAVAGYVLGIAVAIVIIFVVVKGLIWVRKWVTERKLGMNGKFYRGAETRIGDVELEQGGWEVTK